MTTVTYTNNDNKHMWFDANTAKPVVVGWYNVLSNNKTQSIAYFNNFGAWDISHIPEGVKQFVADQGISKLQPMLTGWEELN